MIRSTVGSLLLVLLAALSVSPTLAAPQGGHHASHSPYKYYGSGHSHKRQNSGIPTFTASCALSAGEPLTGDQELVADGIRYSQVCLELLALVLIPEERAACRTECTSCISVRGYDMLCIAERLVQRATQVDLTQFQDTEQLAILMAPTAATDCIVPPEEALPTPVDSNWTPFTFLDGQVFSNDCLSRFYLGSLSSTASCVPSDNTCMIDRALELRDNSS